MKKLLFLLVLCTLTGILTAQINPERTVIIDRIDRPETGGNTRDQLTTVTWSPTRTNPKITNQPLVYTVTDDETGDAIDVLDNAIGENQRDSPFYVVVTSNRSASPVNVDGNTIERTSRSEVNGETVQPETEVIDLTTLPPGDYTIRAKNKRGKEKAEIKVKIKGERQKKTK